MNDAGTTRPAQARGADTHETDTGPGRHREPVASEQDAALPNGRHRKQTDTAGPMD